MAVACVIVVISAVLLLSIYELKSDDSTNVIFNEKYSLGKTSIFMSNDVIIISDEESEVNSEFLGPNVRVQRGFDSISENDVVVINGNYIKSIQLEESDDIKVILTELLKNGSLLILIDKDPKLFESLELSHSFSQSLSGVFCFAVYKTGTTESYSIIGYGAEKSMDLAYEWAKETNDKKNCQL